MNDAQRQGEERVTLWKTLFLLYFYDLRMMLNPFFICMVPPFFGGGARMGLNNLSWKGWRFCATSSGPKFLESFGGSNQLFLSEHALKSHRPLPWPTRSACRHLAMVICLVIRATSTHVLGNNLLHFEDFMSKK